MPGVACDVLGDRRVDAREIDLAGLQRELRGLVVGDRLADDLGEGRLLADDSPD